VQLSRGAYRRLVYAQERIRRTFLGDRRRHGRLAPIALRLRVGLALPHQGIGRFDRLREAKVRKRKFVAAETTAAIPSSRSNQM
jgi:hypothetical protein